MTQMPHRTTRLPAWELELLFTIMPRIYADYRDPRRGPLALTYLYSETTDNEDSNFLKAVELQRGGYLRSLGMCRGSTENGYAGFEHSVERLKAFSFKETTEILPIDVAGNVNTGTEAAALADACRMLKGDLGIIAPPFHLMRAFMTTVTAIQRIKLPLRVYAIPGATAPWSEYVRHSQGTLENTRAGLITDELARLERYRAQEYGSMISAQEAISYLNWRDC